MYALPLLLDVQQRFIYFQKVRHICKAGTNAIVGSGVYSLHAVCTLSVCVLPAACHSAWSEVW